MRRLLLVYNTVKHLKAKQIIYQIKYRFQKPKTLSHYQLAGNSVYHFLAFSDFLPALSCAEPGERFNFLNKEYTFHKSIDWTFNDFGKLWNYNLQYGNYLLQEDIPLDIRLRWLKELHHALDNRTIILEPYPTSLRAINTIRLLSRHKLQDKAIAKSLEAEFMFINARLEYHLLGNHLLENAFSLLMGGAFFNNKLWVTKAVNILYKELDEQILDDGAHFELSPMYHQIVCYRLLEIIDWYRSWQEQQPSVLALFCAKATKMLGWLKKITFENGEIPYLNDSADGITYSSSQLFSYAESLGIEQTNTGLSDSGYRRFGGRNYECIVDVARIGPSYQPGHGHADALSFILYSDKLPILVEYGTSTYQPGNRRDLERSTKAHNTVVINNKNQSDVWGAFRVAGRASVTVLKDLPDKLTAIHDGYKKAGAIHQRSFEFLEDYIEIEDYVESDTQTSNTAYFHFHPDRQVHIEDGIIYIDKKIYIKFTNSLAAESEDYQFSKEYNKYSTGKTIRVKFQTTLVTNIYFN